MTIPIHDDHPTRRHSVITWALIAVCLTIFALSIVDGDLQALPRQFGFIPADFSLALEHETLPRLLPLVSYAVLHNSFAHLFSNMLFTFVFADNVEDRFGRGHFLAFVILSAIASVLAHWAFNPTSEIPTVGASGIVSAVLGAYLVLYPRQLILSLVTIMPLRLPAYLVIGLWFTVQLIDGLTGAASANAIAWTAHIGGFAFGLIWALLQVRRRQRTA